jgi:hypothetical protein
MIYLSECCGAEPHDIFHFDDNQGICGCCQEHAEFEACEEVEDIEHWRKVKEWQERFNRD